MAELWYGALALMLIAYGVLDGFDFGVGALALFLARSDGERRALFEAIGPFWDGNEVWLIAAGGTMMVAFPTLVATAFPGFYLAFFLVLWCLILRGVAIEVRSHVADTMWAAFWDVVFAGSSALLALLFGVALGNWVRGLPLGPEHGFTMALFTDFSARGQVGILDYYTLSVGLLAVITLACHGATFLVVRTAEPIRTRAVRAALRLGALFAIVFALVSLETAVVRPGLYAALLARPIAWLAAALALGGAALWLWALRGGRERFALLGSSLALAAILAATASAGFPYLLWSTLDAQHALRARDALSDPYSIGIANVWWPIALLIAVSYFVRIFRANLGKVSR